MHLPTEIQQMNHSLIYLAHEAARMNPHLTSLLLGSGPGIAATFSALSTQQIYALSHVRLPLFQLRNGTDTQFWTRVLGLLTTDSADDLKAFYGALLLRMADCSDVADALTKPKHGGTGHDLR
mgnify:CR=1 FL=1